MTDGYWHVFMFGILIMGSHDKKRELPFIDEWEAKRRAIKDCAVGSYEPATVGQHSRQQRPVAAVLGSSILNAPYFPLFYVSSDSTA